MCNCLLLSGYELLFQPEIVRIYISLLKESQTPAILEASAGAIQNLCAGRWTVSDHLVQWKDIVIADMFICCSLVKQRKDIAACMGSHGVPHDPKHVELG